MKLPRDVSGEDLVKALRMIGYQVTRQRGSHMRITTQMGGEHHEVVPDHSPIRPGSLSSLLKSVAAHHGIAVDELIGKLKL